MQMLFWVFTKSSAVKLWRERILFPFFSAHWNWSSSHSNSLSWMGWCTMSFTCCWKDRPGNFILFFKIWVCWIL